MCEMYLVQHKYDDGTTSVSLHSASEIIDRVSMRDCSDEEILVYEVSRYGKVKPLIIHDTWHNFNDPLYIKVTDKRGKAVFTGYGTDH